MVTLQSAENALKTVYLGVVSNQLNTNANPLLGKIKQTSKDVWGKEVRKLAPFGINGGIGAGAETDELPKAAGNNYVQFVSDLKNLYGKIELSDKAIRAAKESGNLRIKLVNGEELAKLMIKHNLGVQVKTQIEIKKLDEDFFSEE